MTKSTEETEIQGTARFFLRACGIKLVAEVSGRVRVKRTAGQSPDQSAIEDQSSIIEGELVEDVDPAEVEKLEKL